MGVLDIFRPHRRPAAPAGGGLIRWDKSFSVGNPLIDGEHKAILRLLNQIYDDWVDGAHAVDLVASVDQLGRLLATHFANEETVLRSHHCPELAQHRAEHRRLLVEFDALAATIEAGGADEGALAGFLRRVVVDHVLGHDMALKSYLRR